MYCSRYQSKAIKSHRKASTYFIANLWSNCYSLG